MTEVITPHLRIALTLEEYYAGLGNGYPEMFVTHLDGTIIKRVEYGQGRWYNIKVDKIPTKLAKNLAPLTPELRFLPAGKVPRIMLDQITAFFKAVMTEKFKTATGIKMAHGSYEAMAHIVWNPGRPQVYRVAIPAQEVTGMNVWYGSKDKELEHLEQGDIIIVDIHSHNSMGAFFSGTDEADDKVNTCYSGVIGKLNTDVPEMKFRFNDQSHNKVNVLVPDVFQCETVEVQKEWLDKVTIKTYQSSAWQGGYGGTYGNHYGKAGGAKKPDGDGAKNSQDTFSRQKHRTISDDDEIAMYLAEYGITDDDEFDAQAFLDFENILTEDDSSFSARKDAVNDKMGPVESRFERVYVGNATASWWEDLSNHSVLNLSEKEALESKEGPWMVLNMTTGEYRVGKHIMPNALPHLESASDFDPFDLEELLVTQLASKITELLAQHPDASPEVFLKAALRQLEDAGVAGITLARETFEEFVVESDDDEHTQAIALIDNVSLESFDADSAYACASKLVETHLVASDAVHLGVTIFSEAIQGEEVGLERDNPLLDAIAAEDTLLESSNCVSAWIESTNTTYVKST